ncbi:hypothetical protein HYR54_07015 [Candidatus Acetothermia bacterium]|nr:hypothetical protein [Candidatus Acetothermia bacterium]
MRWFKLMFVGLSLLGSVGFLTSCDEPAPPATNVSGTWVGNTSSVTIEGIPEGLLRTLLLAPDGTLTFEDGLSLELNLKQSDGVTDVTGTAKVGTVLITQTLKVNGRLNERTLNLEASKQFFKDTPTYDVFLYSHVSGDGKSMDGEWSVYEGTNKVKGGTFSVKRQ